MSIEDDDDEGGIITPNGNGHDCNLNFNKTLHCFRFLVFSAPRRGYSLVVLCVGQTFHLPPVADFLSAWYCTLRRWAVLVPLLIVFTRRFAAAYCVHGWMDGNEPHYYASEENLYKFDEKLNLFKFHFTSHGGKV